MTGLAFVLRCTSARVLLTASPETSAACPATIGIVTVLIVALQRQHIQGLNRRGVLSCQLYTRSAQREAKE